MSDIFAVLLLISLLAILVSVIKPNWAMPWAANPKRLKGIGLYAAIAVVCFIGFGITVEEPKEVTTTATSENVDDADAVENNPQPAETQEAATVVTPESEEAETVVVSAPDPQPEEVAEPLSPEELVQQRMPDSQREFLAVMRAAAEEYEDAPNELVKSRIDRERQDAARGITGNEGRVSDWVGILESIGTNGDGNAFVVIRANDQLTFETFDDAFSDLGAETLIAYDSTLYDVLSRLSEGSAVVFTGQMLDENSITEEGSVLEPEFITRFSEIEPLRQEH